MTVSEIAREAQTTVTVSGVSDFAALEAKWRDLESRSEASFFQSWTWTGCLAQERFPNPILVEARESGRTVALALFNRRGRTLYLGESGDPSLDCIYVEYNGVLAEAGREAVLTTDCLRAARAVILWPIVGGLVKSRLVLGGIRAEAAASAAEIGVVICNRSLVAPLVDLAERNGCFLDGRSANTRQQLRRSDREYETKGAIAIARAETVGDANAFLDELAAMHQASWIARRQPGAFSNPFFRRFHRALIARALPRGEVDLLRVSAGAQPIGFLYNFRYRGHSLAYQSGFDYAAAGRHGKPGMTCHLAAIRFAAQWGAARYDFLAGDDRYKRSLSDRAETLQWIEVVGPCSPRSLVRWARDLVTRHRTDRQSPVAPAV